MEATVLLGTVNAADCFCSLNTTLSLSSTVSFFNFMACFLLSHALSALRPYIDRCVSFQIMPSRNNWPKVDQSRCRNISKTVKWNGIMCISKGLSTYLNVIYELFIFITFADISKILFLLCCYWVLSVDKLMKKIYSKNKMWKRWKGLIIFWMRSNLYVAFAKTSSWSDWNG